MKTIVTACGVGYASSTIIAERLKALFERENLTKEVRILQCTFNEVPGHFDSADCIVVSSMVADASSYPIPVFNGVPFLTGIGMEQLENSILEVLRK